jgi:hypothetical protein
MSIPGSHQALSSYTVTVLLVRGRALLSRSTPSLARAAPSSAARSVLYGGSARTRR